MNNEQPTEEQLKAYFPLPMYFYNFDIAKKNADSMDDNIFSRLIRKFLEIKGVIVTVSWGATNGLVEIANGSYYIRITTKERVNLMTIDTAQTVTFILRDE